ncbi:unnamed protein product [Calicophoron daubneyi]|uniref:Fork-head domain-containing protein n=1 Tax=Calicophoron daubneyi TaxID=300641 RepID=A0AAV2T1M6_CALDB
MDRPCDTKLYGLRSSTPGSYNERRQDFKLCHQSSTPLLSSKVRINQSDHGPTCNHVPASRSLIGGNKQANKRTNNLNPDSRGNQITRHLALVNLLRTTGEKIMAHQLTNSPLTGHHSHSQLNENIRSDLPISNISAATDYSLDQAHKFIGSMVQRKDTGPKILGQNSGHITIPHHLIPSSNNDPFSPSLLFVPPEYPSAHLGYYSRSYFAHYGHFNTSVSDAYRSGQHSFKPPLESMHSPEDPKPNFSYIGLIAKAILSTKDRRMILSEIYQWIQANYPYFRTRGPGWRNSIRHNLSLNDCFIKVGRASNGKGHYWGIHPANVRDFVAGDFRRRRAQRKVRQALGLVCPSDDRDTPSPPSPVPFTASPTEQPNHLKRSNKLIHCPGYNTSIQRSDASQYSSSVTRRISPDDLVLSSLRQTDVLANAPLNFCSWLALQMNGSENHFSYKPSGSLFSTQADSFPDPSLTWHSESTQSFNCDKSSVSTQPIRQSSKRQGFTVASLLDSSDSNDDAKDLGYHSGPSAKTQCTSVESQTVGNLDFSGSPLAHSSSIFKGEEDPHNLNAIDFTMRRRLSP